jgi:hypothetical protein
LQRRRRFPHHRVRPWISGHLTLTRSLLPPHGNPQADATAGPLRRFPAPLQPYRLPNRGLLPRRPPPRPLCAGSRPVIPDRRRRSLQGVGIATTTRMRRLPSMRVTTTQISLLRFLTKMRSRPINVSRALRKPCLCGPQQQRRPHLPFPLGPLRGQVRRPSRANLHRRLGNRWMPPGLLRRRLRLPRRRPDSTTTMILTTTPRLHRPSQRCPRTRCHRLLRA